MVEKYTDNKYEDLLKYILDDVKNDLTDDEILHILLDKKISANIHAKNSKGTFGQRADDNIAKIAGSWPFIGIFVVILFIWIALNVMVLKTNAFDPYPFILLNLALSCMAAIQAPLIMMSQNRQEEKDRERGGNDYRVNLKAEIILENLHNTLDEILDRQKSLEEKLKELEPGK